MENNFCEFCWREFGTKTACNLHREICKKNPNYKNKKLSKEEQEEQEEQKHLVAETMDVVEKLSNC